MKVPNILQNIFLINIVGYVLSEHKQLRKKNKRMCINSSYCAHIFPILFLERTSRTYSKSDIRFV